MDRCVLLVVLFGIIVSVLRCCEAAVVQEKQVTSCNSPCSTLQLMCPAHHRLAIREVLFSVVARPAATSKPCSVVHTCGTQTQCCEQTSVQDCVFSYSPSHLKAVHRNCSGARACTVKTERTQEESVACPFFRPEDTVSHTVMDYVCINESAIVDICTVRETQVEGRTLFTMLDTGRWRNPRGGAVCRCTAESVRWPTTNTIAVFVVDMRLNMLREAHCSKADVTLKSGSVTRHLDCESSRDPRQAFPFLALLNHSNVATVELVLHKKLPEIVWIGFESNEVEDIRLTCALQGYVPIVTDENEYLNASGPKTQGHAEAHTDRMDVAAIAGSVVGTLVLCAILVLLVLGIVFYRRRQRQKKPDEYSEPHDTVDDIDVYYSTPELSGPQIIHSGTVSPGPGTKEDSEGEVYVTAAAVRERKRQSAKKVVRILSIPEISNDVAEYYASPWDIRDRRRLEEGGREVATAITAAGAGGAGPPTFFPSSPSSARPSLPPLPSPTACSEDEDDYAMLDRQPRRQTQGSAEHDQCYDHLPVLVVSGAAGAMTLTDPAAASNTTTTTATATTKAAGGGLVKPPVYHYHHHRHHQEGGSHAQMQQREEEEEDPPALPDAVSRDGSQSAGVFGNKKTTTSAQGDRDDDDDPRSDPDGCNHNSAFEGDEAGGAD